MKPRKFETIHCPHCGYEYLPAELFLPQAFFGRPFLIERDNNGKIQEYSGESIDQYETYTCDSCNHTFKITAKLGFTTQEDKLENFDEEYVSVINENSLFLDET